MGGESDPKLLEKLRIDRRERSVYERIQRSSKGIIGISLGFKQGGNLIVSFRDPHLVVEELFKTGLSEVYASVGKLAIAKLRENAEFYHPILRYLRSIGVNIEKEPHVIGIKRYYGPEDYENLVITLTTKKRS